MLRFFSLFLAALSIVCGASSLFAQTVRGLDPAKPMRRYILDTWKVADGLPQESVQALAQTKEGFLWLGTQQGVARFDGDKFTVFDRTNSPLLDRYINVLLTDKGGIWIGSDGGLNYFRENKTWFSFSSKNGLPPNRVTALALDSSGTLWIGTDGGGLVAMKNNVFVIYNTTNGLPDNKILALCVDKNNSLWIGSNAGGLSNFCENKVFRTYNTKNSKIMTDRVNALCCRKDGTLWIGTDKGLNTLTNNIIYNGTLSESIVISIYEDNRSTLWVGTKQFGISRFTNGQWSSFSKADGLSSEQTFSIFEDKEGSLWMGTYAGGLNRFKDCQFTTYSTKDGLSGDLIWTIMQDKNGNFWIGTDGTGLSCLQAGSIGIKSYSTKNGLSSNIIRSVMQDHTSAVWVATRRGGLHKLEGNRITTYTKKDGLASDMMNMVYEDREGTVWLATDDGLNALRNGKWYTYTTKDGLADNRIRSILQTSDGALWIGFRGRGLCRWQNGKIQVFDSTNGLPGTFMCALYEDKYGTLWIGSARNGLFRYRNGTFTHFAPKNGLPDETCYTILEDNQENLWMSCNKGIYKVAKSDLNDFAEGRKKYFACNLYGVADGMQTADCNGGCQPAAWKSSDGSLWFASQGAVVTDPNRVYFNALRPKVIIEKLLVDTTDIFANLPTAGAVSLPSTSEKFEIQYTATSLFAAKRNRFKYLLEGYDKDWTEAGNRRTAYYNNLPRGRSYRFRVIACNNDGVWNETGAWAEFRITPFWWETWWFYGLCVMFVGSASYQGFRWRTRRLRMKAEELERLVDVRTKEVQEQAREIQLANTQLSEKNAEITASRERLEVMSEVGRSLTASLAVETIITNLYQRVAEVMDATVFGIGLYRKETEELEYKIAMERDVRYKPYTRSLANKNQFPVWCLDNRKHIFINDVEHEYSQYLEVNPYSKQEIKMATLDDGSEVKTPRSMLYVPLLLEGSPIGVLSVQSYERNAYSQGDLDTLQTLANYAAIAIANAESTEEIIRQKAIVEEFNCNIQDSIRYAKRIQDAMLPSTETLNRLLPKHFIFFRPKDVVSGDFYWCKEVHGKVFVAAVDCTGHGVPGAFMSLIGNALLNDITQRQTDPHPDTILNELHHELQTVLRQKETNNDDGMDICLCMIDLDTRIVEFAGAMNPLYAVVEGELREFKGTPEELGGREERSPVYQRHSLDLSEVSQGVTMLYLTTDGYKDQYNEARQRFMPKRLRPLLQEIAGKALEEQPQLLGAAIDAHRGDVMQVDDMLVLGVRL